MECRNCSNNYLYKLFGYCLNTYSPVELALEKFDKYCVDSGDPRNLLTILSTMYNNTCDNCKLYSKYYDNILSKL